MENNLCVWRPLVRPLCKPRMQTVRKRNVLSANWSKFLYIFYKHHFNFKTKMRFIWPKVGLMNTVFFSFLCECVSCSYDAMRRQRNHHYFKWIQSRLEGKKNFICRRLFTASRKTSHQEILCLSRAATAKKSDQKSVRHHARAVRAE